MTGISPRELLLGRRPRSRLDLLKSHMVERVERNQLKQKEQHYSTLPYGKNLHYDRHRREKSSRPFKTKTKLYSLSVCTAVFLTPSIVPYIVGVLNITLAVHEKTGSRLHLCNINQCAEPVTDIYTCLVDIAM